MGVDIISGNQSAVSKGVSMGQGSGKWLALAAVLLGWMFDGLEMGLFPLVARPAMMDLMGPDAATKFGPWMANIIALFLVGAALGGVLAGEFG